MAAAEHQAPKKREVKFYSLTIQAEGIQSFRAVLKLLPRCLQLIDGGHGIRVTKKDQVIILFGTKKIEVCSQILDVFAKEFDGKFSGNVEKIDG